MRTRWTGSPIRFDLGVPRSGVTRFNAVVAFVLGLPQQLRWFDSSSSRTQKRQVPRDGSNSDRASRNTHRASLSREICLDQLTNRARSHLAPRLPRRGNEPLSIRRRSVASAVSYGCRFHCRWVIRRSHSRRTKQNRPPRSPLAASTRRTGEPAIRRGIRGEIVRSPRHARGEVTDRGVLQLDPDGPRSSASAPALTNGAQISRKQSVD
jgi:hypothetical protein